MSRPEGAKPPRTARVSQTLPSPNVRIRVSPASGYRNGYGDKFYTYASWPNSISGMMYSSKDSFTPSMSGGMPQAHRVCQNGTGKEILIRFVEIGFQPGEPEEFVEPPSELGINYKYYEADILLY